MNLNQHHIPAIFQKFPVLIRIIWVFRWVLFTRVWVIKSFLQKYRKTNGLAVDLGAGDGQFLPKNISEREYWLALDSAEEHIRFLSAMNPQVTAIRTDIETWMDRVESDKLSWIQCISTLQYLQQPQTFIKNCYRSLAPGGMMMFYVPLHQKQELRLYRWVFEKFPNYENSNRRLHIFSHEDIMNGFKDVGFQIIAFRSTYHFWGRISHELLSIGIICLSQKKIGIKLLGLIWLVLNLPLVLSFNVLESLSGFYSITVSQTQELQDHHRRDTSYNGGVFICKK